MLAALVGLGGCALLSGPAPPDWSARMGQDLRARISGPERAVMIRIRGADLAAAPGLSRFYRQRGDRPAWCGPTGPLARAEDLIRVLGAAEADGLRPGDYRLEALGPALAAWRRGPPAGRTPDRLVELDLLLTDAFLRYAAHLQKGRVRAWEVEEEWQVKSPPMDLAGLLQTALDLNLAGQTLEGLRPPQVGYARLRQALARYRQIARQGGWPRVVGEREWRQGHRHAGVAMLRQRLIVSGDLDSQAVGDPKLFDEAVAPALRRFQGRHGLEESGRVDAATLEELNVPVAERIVQIELNMERWRWLPHHAGTRHILVRIADFELDVVEAGQPVMNMRVIVGKPYWRTPIFSATMTHLVFNPSWYIPESIAVDEILPALRQDSTFLARKQIRVAVGREDTARVVAPDSIDWAAVDTARFNYTFIQVPCPHNPLGRVKFMFPNPFDVYLHDTPNEELFARPVRAFSHGCIRLEKSLDLAAYVLQGAEPWTRDTIQATVDSNQTLRVVLPVPMPVYLLYWTAWVDEEGKVQFRRDLYDSDRKLKEALRE